MKLIAFCISILLSSLIMAHSGAMDSIDFKYTFERAGQSENIIKVNAALTNKSTRWFYFLSESCNGLDYNITTTSTKATPYIIVHCNASTPQKKSIAPGSTYQFTTRIHYVGSLHRLGLNLKLTQVSKAYHVNEKFISAADQKKKRNTILLSGPVLQIPD